MPDDRVLVLRTCDANLQSHGGFQWPESGPVSAPDWSAEPCCDNELHGLLWGEGTWELLDWSKDAKWLVLRVDKSTIVGLEDKVKFPACEVVHCGDQFTATTYLRANGGEGKAIIGVTAIAGDDGDAIAGYYGTAIAGDGGTAAAGDNGTAIAGNGGDAIAGNDGDAIAGDHGAAIAGDNGTAAVGYYGAAIAGDGGTAAAGDYGTATAGYRGIITMRWWDFAAQRYRLAVGYIGEDGLKPHVAYQWEAGKWVEAPLKNA